MKSRAILVLTAGAVAALGVTGSAIAFAGESSRDVRAVRAEQQASNPRSASQDRMPATRQWVTEQQARRIAARIVPGGRFDDNFHTLTKDRRGKDIYVYAIVKGGVRHMIEVEVATGAARRR